EGLAVYGTVDGPHSVLRISSAAGICDDGSASPKPCRHDDECATGVTCAKACVGGTNNGGKCTSVTDCPVPSPAPKHAKPKCGERGNLDETFAAGGWELDRGDARFFQEPTPSRTCSASSATERCVGYQLYVDQAFDLPSPTVTPMPTPGPIPGDLMGELGGGAVVAQSAVSRDVDGSTWLAVAVDRPPPDGGPALFVARTGGCAGAKFCDLRSVALGGRRVAAVKPALAFVGSQLRILAEDPSGDRSADAGPEDFDADAEHQALPLRPVLMLYDTKTRAASADPRSAAPASAVVVRYVDLTDREHYDPLREHASGGTTFVTPGGHCWRGREILPVPSLCDPRLGSAGCPPESTCTAELVVA